jgi:recombination protein RecR
MILPKTLQRLIENFEKLPGIGPKTAQRLAFYLLFVPQQNLDEFSQALARLKKDTILCSQCFNIGETPLCSVCADEKRDKTTVCVVEDPLDAVAIEKSGKFKGLYHILHGAINPLENIGPDDIYIKQLVKRVARNQNIREVILATNPTLEGEATAIYIAKKLREQIPRKLIITRIGRGLPTGADLEYADEVTLNQSLEGRQEI